MAWKSCHPRIKVRPMLNLLNADLLHLIQEEKNEQFEIDGTTTITIGGISKETKD